MVNLNWFRVIGYSIVIIERYVKEVCKWYRFYWLRYKLFGSLVVFWLVFGFGLNSLDLSFGKGYCVMFLNWV